MKPVYKRILLKISGEVLAGEKEAGFDFEKITEICTVIKECADMGVQIGLVVGGGNIWRGRSGGNMNRTRADQMGMLGTVINALAVQDTLISLGAKAEVMNAWDIQRVGRSFNKFDADRLLNEGYIVLFSCGTGNPFFSTDSGAALRAAELDADIYFKATNVDGVYDSDPRKNPDAKKYDEITFDEILEKRLNVMDNTAAALALNSHMPMLVFNLNSPENIKKAVLGENIGTVVKY
ncbi:MAG: UMP kinase [Clostridia bacterium]|nr:UMP kinase [Clostridia bacterium]MBQ9505712.1 UMP kinase [Clostridia bacterium]MBR5424500.1 UMP kinase [Clostridia bacterium]